MASIAKRKPKPRGLKAGEVYPQEEFCERMGWGRKAFMAARDRGLPTVKESRRIYVLSDEALEWLKSRTAAGASK
jgi:hypothetical protein